MKPRRYIRHPSEIPILIRQADHTDTLKLRDISLGGLCVQTSGCLAERTRIWIRIPLLTPPFEAPGRVVWCRYRSPGEALLGISFSDPDTAFAVRMIEQVCHIESYRRRISRERGRDCSSEEAAAEWIVQYARYFPQ